MTATLNDLAQMRRDLEEIRRARRAVMWLRLLGYATRPLAYLAPPAFLLWWLWSGGYLSQPADTLTVGDIFLIGGCIVGFSGLAIPGLLFLFNVDGGEIDWEEWGRIGLWLVPTIFLAGLLLALWAHIR